MHRFARTARVLALALLVFPAFRVSLAAQEASPLPPLSLLSENSLERIKASALQPPPLIPPQTFSIVGRTDRRPRALVPLYVSFASLQGLDAHSTTRALNRGAAEGNPLMRGLAAHPVGLVAIKAAATTGVVYAGEKMWKRNRAAAVVFMVVANSAMVWVVQHNYRAVR